jgi:hypothetical protein
VFEREYFITKDFLFKGGDYEIKDLETAVPERMFSGFPFVMTSRFLTMRGEAQGGRTT